MPANNYSFYLRRFLNCPIPMSIFHKLNMCKIIYPNLTQVPNDKPLTEKQNAYLRPLISS